MPVRMDRIYLSRIFTNMITNAKQAVSEQRKSIILGEDAWAEWMNPALPEDEPIANPYKYLGEDDGHKH